MGAKEAAKASAVGQREALIGFISFLFFFLDDLFQDTLHADWHVPGPRKISVCGVRLSADFKGLGLLGCVHPVSVGFQCKCELSLGSVALLGLLSEIF